jgi:hypothetical protein
MRSEPAETPVPGCPWSVTTSSSSTGTAAAGFSHECCDRLVPADSVSRRELGYTFVSRYMQDQHTPQGWWRDPLNPDVWAIGARPGRYQDVVGVGEEPQQGELGPQLLVVADLGGIVHACSCIVGSRCAAWARRAAASPPQRCAAAHEP